MIPNDEKSMWLVGEERDKVDVGFLVSFLYLYIFTCSLHFAHINVDVLIPSLPWASNIHSVSAQ